MSIPGAANPLLLASTSTAYTVSRSVRLNAPDSAYFSRTPASAGNRTTWTWAGWVKRTSLGTFCPLFSGGTSNNDTLIYFDSGSVGAQDSINWFNRTSGSKNEVRITTQVFRDPSAWQHLVFVWDTNNSTAADRMRLYVNGAQVTSFATSTNPSSGALSNLNTNTLQTIGADSPVTGYFSGYLADVHFIDGQALTPSSFTEVSATTGQLIPKAYTGSFGTNGFWLKFSDNSSNTATTLGKDYSSNGNNWTPTNFSVTAGAGNDSLVETPVSSGADSPAGGVVTGNYCTLNPLAKGSAITLANGNLDWSESASDAKVLGTIGMSSGKWYWEVTCTATNQHMGLATQAANLNAAVGYDAFSWSYGSSSGQKVTNSSGSAYGATYTTGDVIGVAFDADNGTLTFYKNGTSQGQAFSGLTSGPYFAAVGNASTSGSINFGQRPFAYQTAGTNRPASTYLALCDQNLPAPSVAKPSEVMDVLLWSGTGGNRSFSSLNMSPDFVWIKQRNAAFSTGHQLYDIVRGAGSDKELNSAGTAAEGAGNIDQYGWLSSFDSNGFSVTAGPIGADYVNASGTTYVAWTWDAGSSTVTNTQGSITSSVRANTSAGFSVVSWSCLATAGTVGHGLGVAPSLILMKDRNATSAWFVYHKDVGTGKYLQLQSTAATTTNSIVFSTAPTSTVFDPGTAFVTGSGYTATIAYCFAPVAGYSSFGSYTGNGSADGPFVYTGFRPRWILVKRSDSTGNWYTFDTSRDSYNVANKYLLPNSSGAEGTFNFADITSNGFKVRDNSADWNASGGTILYAAFAESPFAYSRAR